ncbi:hypothetical protein AAC768_10360 [Arthrobacter sp. A333]|uniref:Uncharacterized protein n=1 Tax=Arthrobacter nanjingensis TaxID=1387716 RepID=A0ABU9KKX8_9MICC|nr:hypothetical protein [Arthrobacter sp. YJM1]
MTFFARLLLAVALLGGLLGMHGIARGHGHAVTAAAVMSDDGAAHHAPSSRPGASRQVHPPEPAVTPRADGCPGPCDGMAEAGGSCTPAPGPAAPVFGGPPEVGLPAWSPVSSSGAPVVQGTMCRTPSLVELGISRT